MTLIGRNILITGANTGLGLAVSKKFAKMDANTILVCRKKDKGEKAVLEIKKDIPDAKLDLMICDLASLKSIQNFIHEVKARYTSLDVLYNNAAVMKQNRTITEDGFEMMFQVNYLAPFILMNAFLGLLKNGSPSQILNNGRPSEKLRLDFEDLQFSKNYQMYNSFFLTKLCLLFASLESSRRYAGDGFTVIMADPGPFKSDLVRDIPLMNWFKNLISAPVEKAADNILYVATSDVVRSQTGKVYKEKQEYPLSPYWQDTHVSEHLWSISETLTENMLTS